MLKKTEKTVVKKALGRPRKVKPIVEKVEVQPQVKNTEVEQVDVPVVVASPVKNKKSEYISCIGRRKEATARVRFFDRGNGNITVNGQELKKYFSIFQLFDLVFAPLKQIGAMEKYDISIKVAGGGKNSQALAARHGISRALVKFNADLKPALKKAGYMTRDSRVKERNLVTKKLAVLRSGRNVNLQTPPQGGVLN